MAALTERDAAGAGVRPHLLGPVPAFVAGTVAVALVAAALVPFGADLPRSVPALLLLAPVIAAGIVGGRLVAAAVTLEAAFAFALVFLPPIGSPVVELAHDAVVLAIFAVVAGALGTIISTVVASERRRAFAERAQVRALIEVDAQRSALLRSVSHDLRTPLASIQAVVTDLRTDLPYDAATRDDLLALVASESQRLDRLVANLLSMSRIEAGAFLPDRIPVDLGELIDASVDRLAMALGHVAVAIEVPPDLPLVLVDYSQIDQVVTNLVENAARHAPPGSQVRVTARRRADWVEVAVADRGPGIADGDADLVFEPFRGAGDGHSTGLGLAICRSIIEAHGGTIRVDGDHVGGARITFEVPVDPADGAGDRRRPGAAHGPDRQPQGP